jgi:hypothetical protein
MNEWISAMQSVYAMGYYSVIKRKEILTRAVIYINPKDIIFSERIQSRKDKYCLLHSQAVPAVIRFTDTESRMVVASGVGV